MVADWKACTLTPDQLLRLFNRLLQEYNQFLLYDKDSEVLAKDKANTEMFFNLQRDYLEVKKRIKHSPSFVLEYKSNLPGKEQLSEISFK